MISLELWQLILIIGSLGAATLAFVWVAIRLGSPKQTKNLGSYNKDAEKDVEHIFNEQFREELRNRGRLHFEKIITDNAMFLQQDLRLTTSQLNDFMKTTISKTLKEEFAKYEQSINDAKKIATESIEKTQDAIEEQRQVLGQQLAHEIATEKARLLARFEQNMADIINHYVLNAVGNQIDINDQLEYILGELETNKEAIIKDIKSGA